MPADPYVQGDSPTTKLIEFTPAYLGNPMNSPGGGFNLGGKCGTAAGVANPVPEYVPFDLDVKVVDASFSGDEEDPEKFNYHTTLTNKAPVAVDASRFSEAYKDPRPPTIETVGPGGQTFSPGTHNILGPNTYTISGVKKGGDKYCAYIEAEYDSAFVGPGGSGDIIGKAGGPLKDGPICDTITNKPFFRAYGNGISAGGSFNTSGNPASPSSCSGGGYLAGWGNNTLSPTYYRGASGELSALAMVQTVGVGSGLSGFAGTPTRLSFANNIASDITTSTYSPRLGGNFGNTNAHCLTSPDKPASAPAISGNQTIPTTTIAPGNNTKIFVDGDVNITGNITYNQGGWVQVVHPLGFTYWVNNGPTWTKDNVPHFELVATGNIYIAKNVTQLDGLYVAKPLANGSKGQIYTCGDGFSPMDDNITFDECKNQLTVHGSFVANRVNLMRTYGTLRDEKPTLPSSASSGTCPNGSDQLPSSGICWSYTGPLAGMTCEKVNENSDFWWRYNNPSQAYDDNYLCCYS